MTQTDILFIIEPVLNYLDILRVCLKTFFRWFTSGQPGALVNDETQLLTFVESDNVFKLWDLKTSEFVKQIKNPVKQPVTQMIVLNDIVVISFTNEIVAKYSLSQGKFISSFQGISG
jgi:hypothetical protein